MNLICDISTDNFEKEKDIEKSKENINLYSLRNKESIVLLQTLYEIKKIS